MSEMRTGARKFNFSTNDMTQNKVGYPVTLPEDETCPRCKDTVTIMELNDGLCFGCRYGKYLKTWR